MFNTTEQIRLDKAIVTRLSCFSSLFRQRDTKSSEFLEFSSFLKCWRRFHVWDPSETAEQIGLQQGAPKTWVSCRAREWENRSKAKTILCGVCPPPWFFSYQSHLDMNSQSKNKSSSKELIHANTLHEDYFAYKPSVSIPCNTCSMSHMQQQMYSGSPAEIQGSALAENACTSIMVNSTK